MITRWCSLNLPYEATLRLLGRHFIRLSAVLFASLFPAVATAQSTTSLQPDATVLPSRALRLRLLTSWSRYDALLGTPGSPRNIAASLATDSLGSAQLPILTASETAIRTASGLSNFRLSAGQLAAVADSRIVTAPLIVEFGLSSRLTIGVVVPLVETRTTVNATLNQKTGFANVGANPSLTNSSLQAQNAAFVQSLIDAGARLNSKLIDCQKTPAGAGCTALLAQQSTAQDLVQSSGRLAGAIASLYGTGATTPGMLFIPLATDPTQLAISSTIAATRDQFKTLLGETNPVTGTISGANGPPARDDLQQLITAAGHDSIQLADRSSIGDITIGATFQLMNTFPVRGDSGATGGARYRVSINGAYRLGTGQPANRNRFFDNSTGFGQPGVEAGMAADVDLGSRWSGSAIGSYTMQIGTVDVNRVPNALNAALPLGIPYIGSYSAGNVLSLSIVPRYRLSKYFGFTGRYSLIRVGADSYSNLSLGVPTELGANVVFNPPANPGLSAATAHQIGGGVAYSTILGSDRGPGRMPFEASFSHLETIAASGGPTPKTFRDQIEVRLFFGR